MADVLNTIWLHDRSVCATARSQPQPPQNFSQQFEAPYQNQTQPNTYPRVQAPAPTQSNPSFEDKVLQALKGLEVNTQLLHSHTQSIAKLETQVD